MLAGDATEQTPPDLPSYLFKERIVYLVRSALVTAIVILQYDEWVDIGLCCKIQGTQCAGYVAGSISDRASDGRAAVSAIRCT